MAPSDRIIPIRLEEEMKSAYIDYSMSVIVSRALPDVRDGLKPVHRRVLYGMQDLGLHYNKSAKKSARIVGEVLGKYHPHGDQSVYAAMVRMAQDWSLRYPLVEGQGNFGSMDGDSPAAMRYTEAKLDKISEELLADINKNTVDYRLNFDDTTKEPTVLPSKLPNLLINGASGIAVGMATNMLPHNLTEVLNGTVAMVDNPDITVDELAEFIKAPDFPTGGIIYGYKGVKDALQTGRGRIVVRGKADIETLSTGRERIIISEIPYQVNKASLVVKIAELVNDEKIVGISDIRDESDRKGLRIVVEVKRDAMASVVLSKIYKYSPLQSSYGVNNVALVNGRPQTLNVKDILQEFIKFRLEVIVRRTQFDLDKALSRAHILVSLLVALDYIDAVIDLIRSSPNPDVAKEGLQKGKFIDDLDKFWSQFKTLIDDTPSKDAPLPEGDILTEVQAKAILEMRLQRLTGLERDKIQGEYDELLTKINHFRSILADEGLQRGIIKDECNEIKEKFGDERRTEISYSDGEISIKDMIASEDVVITISHLGYIKRTPLTEFRSQNRGGTGSKGAKTRDKDFIEHLFIANTHNTLLLFTEQGKCHWLKVYEIPEASKASSGRVIQNLLNIPKDDKVKAYINIEDLEDTEFLDNHYIMFCTKRGQVKKTPMEAFSRPRSNGIQAITIHEGDMLLEAKLTNGKNEILLAVKSGRAIRFNESHVRSMGRSAAGVRGISITNHDTNEVVGMVCVNLEWENPTIMVISENGYGKRTNLEDYRITSRGGKGVKTQQVTEKTGEVVAVKAVMQDDDVMITTLNGVTIRIKAEDISITGRATQGVKIIRLKKDKIADVAAIRDFEQEEDEVNSEEE